MIDSGAGPSIARTWAIVPLRGLEDAKTRLGAELDPEERLALVTGMTERTLTATREAARITGTILATADPAAGALARRLGARTIVQRLPGLNAAIEEARAVAVTAGATAILVVPVDLAAVSAAAIDTVVEAAGLTRSADPSRAVVVLVPDRHHEGTNALLVTPPWAIDPAFGPGSSNAHRAAAEVAGATLVELGGALTLDVDTAADLLALEAGVGRDG